MKRPYRLDKVPEHQQIDIVIWSLTSYARCKYQPVFWGMFNDMVQEAYHGLENKHTVMVVMRIGGFDGIYEL
jgi:hypothetical protein